MEHPTTAVQTPTHPVKLHGWYGPRDGLWYVDQRPTTAQTTATTPTGHTPPDDNLLDWLADWLDDDDCLPPLTDDF